MTKGKTLEERMAARRNAARGGRPEATGHLYTKGARVRGIFGEGTITELTDAFGGCAYWVRFDDVPDDCKLCPESGVTPIASVLVPALVPGLTVEVFAGRKGDRSHITRKEVGAVPVSALLALKGARGEVRAPRADGGFGNHDAASWAAFVAEIAAGRWEARGGDVFVIVDPGRDPVIAEGNHRVQAALIALGPDAVVPVEVRYYGKRDLDGLAFPGVPRKRRDRPRDP